MSFSPSRGGLASAAGRLLLAAAAAAALLARGAAGVSMGGAYWRDQLELAEGWAALAHTLADLPLLRPQHALDATGMAIAGTDCGPPGATVMLPPTSVQTDRSVFVGSRTPSPSPTAAPPLAPFPRSVCSLLIGHSTPDPRGPSKSLGARLPMPEAALGLVLLFMPERWARLEGNHSQLLVADRQGQDPGPAAAALRRFASAAAVHAPLDALGAARAVGACVLGGVASSASYRMSSRNFADMPPVLDSVVCSFDGRSWLEQAPLPALVHSAAAASAYGQLYLIGGMRSVPGGAPSAELASSVLVADVRFERPGASGALPWKIAAWRVALRVAPFGERVNLWAGPLLCADTGTDSRHVAELSVVGGSSAPPLPMDASGSSSSSVTLYSDFWVVRGGNVSDPSSWHVIGDNLPVSPKSYADPYSHPASFWLADAAGNVSLESSRVLMGNAGRNRVPAAGGVPWSTCVLYSGTSVASSVADASSSDPDNPGFDLKFFVARPSYCNGQKGMGSSVMGVRTWSPATSILRFFEDHNMFAALGFGDYVGGSSVQTLEFGPCDVCDTGSFNSGCNRTSHHPTCSVCSTCPPGSFQIRECSSEEHNVGSFANEHCGPCTASCPAGLYALQNCNSMSDLLCGANPPPSSGDADLTAASPAASAIAAIAATGSLLGIAVLLLLGFATHRVRESRRTARAAVASPTRAANVETVDAGTIAAGSGGGGGVPSGRAERVERAARLASSWIRANSMPNQVFPSISQNGRNRELVVVPSPVAGPAAAAAAQAAARAGGRSALIHRPDELPPSSLPSSFSSDGDLDHSMDKDDLSAFTNDERESVSSAVVTSETAARGAIAGTVGSGRGAFAPIQPPHFAAAAAAAAGAAADAVSPPSLLLQRRQQQQQQQQLGQQLERQQ